MLQNSRFSTYFYVKLHIFYYFQADSLGELKFCKISYGNAIFRNAKTKFASRNSNLRE